jgi:hypothetical protein
MKTKSNKQAKPVKPEIKAKDIKPLKNPTGGALRTDL